MKATRGSIGLAAALGLCLICAASAGATGGTITRADANGAWTQGSVAGSLTWTGCVRESDAGLLPEMHIDVFEPPYPPPRAPLSDYPPSYCGWIAFATVGPGSDVAQCAAADRWHPDDPDAEIGPAWQGEEHRDEIATEEFDVSGVPLSGGETQLVCLSVVEYAPEIPLCLGGEGIDLCPAYEMTPYTRTVAAATLVVAESPAVEPEWPERASAATTGAVLAPSTDPFAVTISTPLESFHRRHGHTRARRK